MSATHQRQPSQASATRTRPATVDLIIPVHNEERALSGCVQVLTAYMTEHFPFSWSVTVVDNASADRTLTIAHQLADLDNRVRVLHLADPGRGGALRTAWTYSDADIVVYMDVDLSTGLDALLPMVAPLINRHSDLAVGTRLAPGSRTIRGSKREFVSRAYNRTIQWTHGAKFSDAQCGFKAARTEVIRPLLAKVRDDQWFFDTELLLLAEHNGLRVHEVPVDWVEDVDSRVNVVRTAAADLAGLVRVARAKVTGDARVTDLPRRAAPRASHPDATLARRDNGLLWQVLSFGVIGLISTALTAVLYALLRTWWPPLIANLFALIVATVWNTEANRRHTFGRDSTTTGTQLRGLLVFGVYYLITSGALLTLTAVDPHPARWVEVSVLIGSSVLGTVLRFVLLRTWVFARSRRAGDPEEGVA